MAPKMRGTSPFTVDDSAGVSKDLSRPEDFEAFQKGEEVSPLQAQGIDEVVLGPGAYGSPDPRTLSHILLSDGDEQMKSDVAPDVQLQGAAGQALTAESKAAEFVDAVKNAESVEELDAIEETHDEREEPLKTVQDALDKKREELESSEDQ